MNKRLFSLLLAALLLAALLPAAALAEGNIIVNLGSVRAGSALDLQIATTESGTASLLSGTLPDSCSIVTEERGGLSAHYLRGTPNLAGSCEFTLAVTDVVPVEPEEGAEEGEDGEASGETTQEITVATLSCSIGVLPAIPSCTLQDLDCFVGEDVSLRLQASVGDGGTLSYQWYSNTVRDNVDGTLLEGKTEAEFKPDTEFIDESYYYCVVTNNNNGLTESVVSPAVTVRVTEPVITELAIASLPSKLEYTEGDTLDAKGLVLTVHYSNGMIVTDDEGFTLSPTKLEKPGTQTVTVKYRDKEITFPVIVSEAKETVEGLSVKTLPLKREYRQGERIDLNGLELETITNKGNRQTVTGGYTVSPEILSAAGPQTVTISYEGKTTSFTVTVQAGEKTVQKIAIQTLPTLLTYQVGDSFDSKGMTLLVSTDQGDELIRSGFSWSPARFTRAGTQLVTISYGGQSCTMELTVSPSPEQEPAETRAPAAEEPTGSDAPEEGRVPESRRSTGRESTSTLLLVILFAALVALVAVIAYLFVSKKDEIASLWRSVTGRGEDEDENDEE